MILKVVPFDGVARRRGVHLAARTTLIALPFAGLLWWAPVVFSLTRSLTFLILAFAAVRLAIASLIPGAAPRWLAPLGAVAGGALGASVLLLIKLQGVGWASAID